MKKAKILSLLLAAVMLLSLLPAVSLTAVAFAESAKPTMLPGGYTIQSTDLYIDWDNENLDGKQTNAYGAVANATTTGRDNQLVAYPRYLDSNNSLQYEYTTRWRGASGVMFYVEQADNSKAVDFNVTLVGGGTRPKYDNTTGYVRFTTSPDQAAYKYKNTYIAKEGAVTTAYWYDEVNGQWEDFGTKILQNDSQQYQLCDSSYGSGWYYIPFSSFYYFGAGGTELWWKGSGNFVDEPLGKSDFYDFMNYFEDQTLSGVAISSTKTAQKFGDIYFVFPELEDDSSMSSAGAFFDANGGIQSSASWNHFGNADYTVENGTSNKKATVTGMAGNSLSSSENNVTLVDTADGNREGISGATGIRFTVDTTALGDAQLQLRLRIQSYDYASAVVGTTDSTKKLVYAAGKAGYVGAGNSLISYSALFQNSVAYYYENGVAKPLHITGTDSANADLFEALPKGYKGDIYIPMESFGAMFGANEKYLFPVDIINESHDAWAILIAHAYNGTPAEDKVVYSNFQMLYANESINSVNVTISDTLDLNFFKKTNTAANETVTYSFEEDSDNAPFAEGKFSYEILPQQMAEKITLTYTATVGGTNGTKTNEVKQTVSISVAEYLNKLLQGAPSGNLQKLIADMLNYGAAAQKIAGGAAITTIGGGTTVTERTATVAKNLTTSTDAGKSFKSATIRLESAVALRLNLNLDTTENVTVKVTLNGREQTFTGDELAAKTILYTDIKATEYDDEITATISVGDDVKQTLTYSVNTYLAALDTADADYDALADAVWAYGQSASAYAAAPDAGN